ncbi:MAG TPA: hypothetical protein PLV45_12650 [bacterium]|nr:hypothetical protein [bacterium]
MERLGHLKMDKGLPYLSMCRCLGIPYSSFMRWRSRIASGRPPCMKPGPKPIEPLPLETILPLINSLDHGYHRTHGTGNAYDSVRNHISRRDFNDLVAVLRRDHVRMERLGYCCITWHVPGMVWAVDDMVYMDPGFLRKHHIHSIRDLASRYTFVPLTAFIEIHGDRIAAHLDALFEQHGPPMFLKRDNGSNLNHHAVNTVLSEWMVIPVNSPAYYPRYNGSIEQTQSELKDELNHRICASDRELLLFAESAVHTLNHRSRPCLDGNSSCRIIRTGKETMKAFHRRKRREVYEEIMVITGRLMESEFKIDSLDATRRYAVEIWLQENGYMSVTNNEKCYPIFSAKFTHN